MITSITPSKEVTLSKNSKVDTDHAVEVAVRAFERDPVVRWLFPLDDNYHSVFSRFVRAYAAKAIESGNIHVASDYSGAAFWQAPGEQSDEEAIMNILQENLQGNHLEESFALFEKIEPYHPTQEHWYLPILGVDPDHQNGGIGSELIQRQLRICDQQNLPVFLESSNRANLSFYQRHGFKLMAEVSTGNSPSLFPMIREARP